ncbi:MAG: radical SAM protein [Deltaproteobacteria bacterium]|nr:radical SAM protein [Deltaproteobacteria bacterium]
MAVLQHFKTGIALTRSIAHYRGHATPRPISASFAVTNRCNLSCSYCNFPNLDPSQLSLEQIRQLFSNLAQMGVARLGLVGGEPLLRADLPAIAAEAKSHGFFVSLNTNLTLLERFPERMPDVDLVFTSLDGMPETHRQARGKKSFDGVLEGIQELRGKKLPVVAITVLTAQATEDIDALIRLATQNDFKLHFQPQCTDTDIVKGKLGEMYNTKRESHIWQKILDAKGQGAPIASSSAYLRHMSNWDNFAMASIMNPESRCAAGYGFLFIDPQGLAYPCAYTKGKAKGIDLLTQNWQEQFTGKTPCTECAVGPMVEFNLLYKQPLASAYNMITSYGIGT